MKLIFALILLVGIMAWFLMPSQSQNSTSSNQSTVQTSGNNSKPAGKAIWDGKLTYDINTVDELFDKQHSELTAEEAMIKFIFAPAVALNKQDWSIYTECMTDRAKQRFLKLVNDKKQLDRVINEIQTNSEIAVTVIASSEKEKTAKVIYIITLPQNRNSDNRAASYLNLIKYKHGWVSDIVIDDPLPSIFINGIGHISTGFMRTQADGTVTRINIKARQENKYKGGVLDISDKHITVYDLLKYDLQK